MDQLDLYAKFLGKEVRVTIDRPLGSKHPRHDFVYETNYGYIPNTKAGDGHEIDAYVLEENTPLDEFTGICIAIILRKDDNENKLVVSKSELDAESISKQVAFVEDHYDTKLILMKQVLSQTTHKNSEKH